jgi:hypothetical protein
MGYCTEAQAAALDKSLEQADIQADWLEWADGLIDQWREKTYADEVEITEALDGNGDEMLVLSHRPVTAVSSVLIDETGLSSDAYAWYANGHLVMKAWPLLLDWPAPSAWPVGSQNVQVTYKYGLASSGSVPAEVTLCAAQLVCLLARYVKSSDLAGGWERWTIGSVTSERHGSSGGLMAEAKAVLESTLGARPPRFYG